MAIAYDNSGYMSYNNTTTSWSTANYTVTGSNTLLVVTTFFVGTDQTPLTISYNGVNLIQAGGAPTHLESNDYTSIWYALGVSGTHTINLTKSIAGSTCFVSAASYTGVKQTGQPDAYSSNTSTSGTSISTTITTVADNSWIVASMTADNGIPSSTSANLSLRVNNGSQSAFFDTNGVIHPAGATAITNNCTGNTAGICIVGVSFSPATGGAGANGNFLSFM